MGEAPADEAGGEMMEGLKDVGAPFVAGGDPAVAGEPGQGSFDNHPAVPTQTLGTVDAAPGNFGARWRAVAVGSRTGGSAAREGVDHRPQLIGN